MSLKPVNFFMNAWPKIEKKEWRTVLVIALLLTLLSAIPITLAIFRVQDGFAYSGMGRSSAGDVPVYFSYIAQGKNGAWLLRDRHTSELEKVGTLNIVWLGLGKLVRAFNVSPIFIFHAARIFLAIPLVFASYFLVSIFESGKRARIGALVLIVFGSGLGGWFAPLFQNVFWSREGKINFPMDISVPEMSVLGSVLQSPHLVFSWIFFILNAGVLILAFRRGSIFWAAVSGLLGLLFFQFHPYYAPFFYFLALSWAVIGLKDKLTIRKSFIIFAVYLLISIPSVFYHLFLTWGDTVVFARAAQNRTITPSFYLTLISLGMFLPLASLGLWKAIGSWQARYLGVWAAISLSFLYAPISFNRRFSEGIFIPLALLTVIGMTPLFKQIKLAMGKVLPNKFIHLCATFGAFFIFFGYSNYLILRNRIEDARYLSPPVFLSQEFLDSLNFIKSLDGDIVLSSFASGNVIPYYSGKRVYAGHWAETIFWEQKELALKKFYNGETIDNWREDFLRRSGISIVFWGPDERKLGNWNPQGADFLTPIYEAGEYSVFFLKKSPPI